MSNEKALPTLAFPLQEVPPGAELLAIRDIDIVGVGALRRHQVEELQKKNRNLILQTYEDLIPESVHSIYSAEILRTLSWLRPLKTEKGPRFDFTQEQKNIFQRLFPRTYEALGISADRLLEQYLQDMEWSSWLLQDHWRYFAGFLRTKFSDNKPLLEVAHWEWVQAWIEIQPFESLTREKDVISLNPSLQIVSLATDNIVLGRDQGLYAFVYDEQKATVQEKKLDLYEAQILDLLQEDRKYSLEQLLQQALLSDEITTQINQNEWRKKFGSLQEQAILLA